MNDIIEIVLLAIAAALTVAFIKKVSPDYAQLAAASAGVILASVLMGRLIPIFDYLKELSTNYGFSGYLEIMLKALGITLACQMAADVCRDCGEGGIASRVELAGKIGVLTLAFPIVGQLLETVTDFIK